MIKIKEKYISNIYFEISSMHIQNWLVLSPPLSRRYCKSLPLYKYTLYFIYTNDEKTSIKTNWHSFKIYRNVENQFKYYSHFHITNHSWLNFEYARRLFDRSHPTFLCEIPSDLYKSNCGISNLIVQV